jgi:hypothetical protein
LKRIVHMPNRNNFRLTTLMEKYLERYKKLLPTCVPYTYGLIGLQSLDLEPSLQKEKWIDLLKAFLGMKKR